MRKSFICSLLLFSQVVFSKTPINDVEKYATFCRVYGIVKYYSNDVSQGKINWDAHTVNYIPKIELVKNSEDFNQLLRDYLSIIISKESDSPMLIDYDKIQKKYKTGKLEKRVSFDWIENNLITIENQKKIKNIISSFEMKKNVAFELGEKKKKIYHKEIFKFDENLLNSNHFLLGFFQYWNVIEYYFPHKNLMDSTWDSVLENKVTAFLKIEKRENYIKKIWNVSSYINDSHGFVDDLSIKENVKKAHPFSFYLIENKYVLYSVNSDSLQNIMPVKKGTILTHIDNIPVDSLLKNYQGRTPNSRESIARYYFIKDLNSSSFLNDSACFTFNDTTKIYTKKVLLPKFDRKEYLIKRVPFRDLNDSTGYIHTSKVNFFEFGRTMRKFRNKKYIIFDCRGYPGLSVLRYGVLLGGKPKNVSALNYPFYRLPGHYSYTKENYFGSVAEMGLKVLGVMPENAGNIIPSFKRPYKGKIIVLMNEWALSFGETNIMTLKTYAKDCVIIGSNSAGANGDVATSPLVGNLEIGFTGLDFRFADGTQLQRVGIKPDIEVKPTLKDFIKGEDTLLNYSLEYIKKH